MTALDTSTRRNLKQLAAKASSSRHARRRQKKGGTRMFHPPTRLGPLERGIPASASGHSPRELRAGALSGRHRRSVVAPNQTCTYERTAVERKRRVPA